MQDAVDAAPALAQLVRHGLDVLGAVDVELEHVGRRVELGRRPLGHPPHAAERGEDHLGAGLLGLARDLVRDRLAVDDAGDEKLLVLQERHSGIGTNSVPSSGIVDSTRRRRRLAATARRRARGRRSFSSWLTTFHANVTRPASSAPGRELGDPALDVERVAEPHRALERRLRHLPQRDHAARIERHEPGRQRDDEHAVGDPLAERRRRRPLRVRVLRMPVAGQLREADHVGLGHRPPAGGELLADLERLERRPPADRVGDRRGHSGMFLTPSAGCAIASRVRQRLGQPPARVAREDDLVDEALGGGGAGAQVLVRVLGRELVARGGRVVGGGDVAPLDDRHGLLGAHDAELGLRPRERVVGAQVAGVHRDERAAERLAQHDRHLRHGGLGERVHELGAVTDHAELLLLGAGHEARRVDEHDERQPERVAGADEARALGRGLGVEHAAQVARLVGDHADRLAVHAREPADDVLRPLLAVLEQPAAVDQAADDVAHVVDAALVVRHGLAGVVADRADRAPLRRTLGRVLRQVVEQIAGQQRRVGIARSDEVRHAVALVHLVAAELGRAHVLAHDLAHDRGAGQEHVRPLGHDHEVRQGGRVRAAAGGRAADHRDLRDLAAQRDVLAEDPRVAGQRGGALRDARAAGLDEADDGSAGAAGEPQHLHDRIRVLLAQRAAQVGRVLRVAEDRAAVDAAGTGDDAVTGTRLLAHPARAHVRAQQGERAAVAERLQALHGGKPLLLFLLLDHLDGHATSRQSTALCPPKPNALDRATAGLPLMSRVRASFGT